MENIFLGFILVINKSMPHVTNIILQTMSSQDGYVAFKAMCTARVAILQLRKWLMDLPALITSQNARFATVSRGYHSLMENFPQDSFLFCGWRPGLRNMDIFQNKETLSLYAKLSRGTKDKMKVVLQVGILEEFMVGHVTPATLIPVEHPFCSYDAYRSEVMDNILRRSYWQQPHLANNCFFFSVPGRGC